MSVGISDVANAIEELEKSARESGGDVSLKLARVLREFQKEVRGDGHTNLFKV